MASTFTVFPEVFLCFVMIHIVFIMILHLLYMLEEGDDKYINIYDMNQMIQRNREIESTNDTLLDTTGLIRSRPRRIRTYPIHPIYPDTWFQTLAYAVSMGRIIYFIAGGMSVSCHDTHMQLGVTTPTRYTPYISLLASFSYLPLFALITLHLWIRYEILYIRKFRNILKLQTLSSRWKRLNWTWSCLMLSLFLSLTLCDIYITHDTSISIHIPSSHISLPSNYTQAICYKPTYADLNFIGYSHHAPYHVIPYSSPIIHHTLSDDVSWISRIWSVCMILFHELRPSIYTLRFMKWCIILIGTSILSLFYIIAAVFSTVLGIKLQSLTIISCIPMDTSTNGRPTITYTIQSQLDLISTSQTSIQQRITWPTSWLWSCMMSICLMISAVINTMSHSHPHIFFDKFRIYQSLYLSSEIVILCIIARLSCTYTQMIIPPVSHDNRIRAPIAA